MVKSFAERQPGTLDATFVEQKVVPDDEEIIFNTLKLGMTKEDGFISKRFVCQNCVPNVFFA